MARLEPYLMHPLAEAAGWALLHSLWQGALVALLFAGALMLMRNRGPQLRYLLGCAALVLLVVPPVVTGTLLYDPGGQPLSGREPQTRIGLGGGAPTTLVQADGAAPAVSAPNALPAAPVLESLVVRALGLLETGAPWLAGVWLVGVVLLLLRLCGQALYVQRFRARHQTPADAVWQARTRALATRLGVRRVWRLVQSEQAESPLTFGILRPLIVLPTSALTGMPAAQLEALLAHELAHIRRHDYLVNLVQCVAETLLFYHPAAWWVSGEVRRAREECCDDLAVSLCGDAKLYARALTNLETLRQHQPASVLAAMDGPLLARVRRLLGLRRVGHAPSSGVLLLLLLSSMLAFFAVSQPVAAQDAEPAASISGTVSWQDAPVTNMRVELQSPMDFSYSPEAECCEAPRILQSTTTDAAGRYTFEDVAPGTYAVWLRPENALYWGQGRDIEVGEDDLRKVIDFQAQKVMVNLGPDAVAGVSLTPTLRWRAYPNAVRYEVNMFDDTSGERLFTDSTTATSLKVENLLEANSRYQWFVSAYVADGSELAYTPTGWFTTAPAEPTRMVTLLEPDVRASLPTSWREVSPGTFEQPTPDGTYRLSVARFSSTDPEAVLREQLPQVGQIYKSTIQGRTWWSVYSLSEEVEWSTANATQRGSSVYLLKLKSAGGDTWAFNNLVIPNLYRTFAIDN